MMTKERDKKRVWTLEPESYAGLSESTLAGGPVGSEPLLPQAPPLLSPGGRLITSVASLWHTSEIFDEVLLVLHDPGSGRTGAVIVDVVDARLRPEIAEREPMRCADLAIDALISALASPGERPTRWVATLVGGSCDPEADALFHRGQRLQSMLMRLLDRRSIFERRCDLGGTGRRVCVMDAGLLKIRKGETEVTLSCVA